MDLDAKLWLRRMELVQRVVELERQLATHEEILKFLNSILAQLKERG